MARKKRTSKAAPDTDVRPHPPEAVAGGDVIVRLPPKLGKRLAPNGFSGVSREESAVTLWPWPLPVLAASAAFPATACRRILYQNRPKTRLVLGEILAITDRFCDEHLDEEYKALCRDMAAVLCVEGFPLTGGKAAGWAAGIVYSVGWINFIGDPSQPHHMKSEDMAPALGVSPATLMNRARDVREGLGLVRMDPRWSTKAMLERNPLLRMAEYLAGDEEGV